MMPAETILVAACGNVMAADDALGPMVAARLRERQLPGVEVIDLDLRPAGLLDLLIVPRSALIVVDACQIEDRSESDENLIEIRWREGGKEAIIHDDVLSTHGLSIANQLEMAEAMDLLPEEAWLELARIRNATIGEAPSDEIESAAQVIAKRIEVLTEKLHEPA